MAEFSQLHNSNPETIEPQLVLLNDSESSNEMGSYQLIELRTKNIAFAFPNRELISKDLELIYGIGSLTSSRLKNAGFNQLNDLLDHPRWSKAASQLIRLIENQNVQQLYAYGASDLELLSFFEPGQIKFVDIETLGLFYAYPVFLIGILEFRKGVGYIRQLLARNYQEEIAILAELDNEFRNSGVIASYNGKSFDVPYLQGRLRYYQFDATFNAFHLDLLRHTRRNYRSTLPNCRLTTIEKFILKEERTDDLPGSEAPLVYQQYLDSGERKLLDPILKHNAWDLLALAKILGLLTSELEEGVAFNGC